MKKKHITCICTLIAVTMLFAAPSYAAYESSLIRYFKFDAQSGGTAYDATGNYNGTILGGAARTAGGKHDWALDFDGNASYVDTWGTYLGETADGTVSLWAKSDAFSAPFNTYASKSLTAATGSFQLGVWNTGLAVFAFFDGSQWHVTGSSTLSTGQWYHVTATWGSAGMKFYIDGDLKDTDSYTGHGVHGNYTFTIGGWKEQLSDPNYDSFDGPLDDFAMWNRALDPYEVDSVYDVGVETFEDILIGMNTTFSLGYSTDEINRLCQLYADGEDGLNPEMIYVDGLWWKYLDTLPNEGAHAMGEAYLHDGRRYIKLGSGLAGNPIPEPASIIGTLLGISFAIKRRKR